MHKIAPEIRNYRTASKRADEQSFQVMLGESDLWISCSKNAPKELPALVLEKLRELRAGISAWGAMNPAFFHSLVPLPQAPKAPLTVQKMLKGAAAMQVGPMAAVAGVIAEEIARFCLQFSQEVLIENGGDIYIFSQRERVVALLPDPQNQSALAIKLPEKNFPLAVCSSSATMGHSLSFGRGELATIIAKDGAFADAAATAFCNKLKQADDIPQLLKKAERHNDILGIFLQCSEQLGLWGELELEVIKA